jgi:hypothetical protein
MSGADKADKGGQTEFVRDDGRQVPGRTNRTPPLKGGVYGVVRPLVRQYLPGAVIRPLVREHLPDVLDELAQRVKQLAPSHRDPERYHVEKSEIENALRCLARQAQPSKGNRT